MIRLFIPVLILLALSGYVISGCGSGKSEPAPGTQSKSGESSEGGSMDTRAETIVLGGGCFWCTEAVFSMVDGITGTTAGYAGGSTRDPKYEDVCDGNTGHAEVVRISFDPARITLGNLLDLFFASHDPTSVNRQGADTGTQYRSIILYTSEAQKAEVDACIKKAQSGYSDRIVTEVVELDTFYPAEDYHQDYYEKNPNAPYCSSVISPKVKKIKDML